MMGVAQTLTLFGTSLTAIAALYACVAVWANSRTLRHPPARTASSSQPPITVFKPLCGAEPHLYENLATFCEQNYPRYQLLCGVRSPNDPAIAVVKRLRDAYPARQIELIVDPRIHGSNPKISNLINIAPYAAHDIFVIADSDIAVAPGYLSSVTAPLADPAVGIVTCLYRGRPVDGAGRGRFWTRLGALFINDWFAPSVRVAHAFGTQQFGFGATLALRRDTLNAIGGFTALANRLADDYWLAELTRRCSLRTVLSKVTVSTNVAERRLTDLWSRELRWLRTIRSINPLGYAFLFITFTSPLLAIGALFTNNGIGFGCSLLGSFARLLLHWQHRPLAATHSQAARQAWLIPLRDTLLLAEWCAALVGQRVRWGQHELLI